MKPAESPFPCQWVGTSLEKAGLGQERPDLGTYGVYAFEALPPLPFEMRGDFAWLASAEVHDECIADEGAAENAEALPELQRRCSRLKLALPAPFLRFTQDRDLLRRVRSNTDCFLDVCRKPIRSPIGDGYLVRFLADSQGCFYWYLYLTPGGLDHAVVGSPGFYGTSDEDWQDEPPDPSAIAFVAESFESFMCRFWLENEIWFAAYGYTAMPAAGSAYIERYKTRAT